MKNRPALFILSPPRSGSTLLRVMLAGHPGLFAPPELELLSFHTLQERKKALSGRFAFYREGAIRAIMELKGCSLPAAEELMNRAEDQDLSVSDFYGELQRDLGGRMLIDKTPSYALEESTLNRAEEVFDNPYYIHLVRNPYAMILSFEEAKLEQVFFRYEHSFAPRTLAELIWSVSQQNILGFLAHVDPRRQLRVYFEDLVANPETTARAITDFLGIDFQQEMLKVYEDKGSRMTDAVRPESRMVGDAKFHLHNSITPVSADRWKAAYDRDFLGDVTKQIAESLGYTDLTIAAREAVTPLRELETQPIPRADHSHPVPLSFAQQRLWLIDQLEPGSTAYNMPAAARLTGLMNVDALERAFNEIVRRHEALRTTFRAIGGQPVQVIHSHQPFTLPITSLEHLPLHERDAEAMRFAQEDGVRPFDLATGPLIRPSLLRLSDHEHVLLIPMHHIVSDGWSMGVLLKEIAALYGAYSTDNPSPLPELAIQYADYAVWQRDWLPGDVLDTQLAYWRDQLAGVAVLDLPVDHPRPAVPSYRGGRMDFSLDAEAALSLRDLSQREGGTLFMTLLAAWQLLLSRYSRQDDIAVGSPAAGRNRAETGNLIGFFVNTLVLRADISGRPAFTELLRRVRETCLNAYRHQDIPFDHLVEAFAPTRDFSRHPLFQVMFDLQSAPPGTLALNGVTLDPIDLMQQTAKFDLMLTLTETPSGLAGSMEFAADLFETVTIERMAGHLRNLLQGIAADPSRPISDFALLGEAERHQLIIEWNDTRREYPGQACVHQLFEQQAARTPNVPALVFAGVALSYSDLNGKANQLAHYLRTRGVGAEARVGLLVRRSPEMIIGILGILKAGGAYVPLDPEYPVERVAHVLRDSGVRVLLTQEGLLESLIPHDPSLESGEARVNPLSEWEAEDDSGINPQSSLAPRPSVAGNWDSEICLDRDWGAIAQMGSVNPVSKSGSQNLAYVMYTSGSTGIPRGVAVTHQSITRLVINTNYVEITQRDSVLQFASAAFDASTLEIWGALLNGAVLVLHPSGMPDLHELGAFIESHGITVLWLTARLFDEIATHQLHRLRGVRQLLAGGEALSVPHVQRALLALPHCRIINGYGPTENTTFTACHHIREADGGRGSIPIGRPIANTRVYILDTEYQLVPIGVPGELYTGGDGLARGYWNDPSLTAERFSPNPFAGEPGGRMYRTGDLAAYLPDGSIEYLGRLDHQVKIRGFRIELGEIEAVLAQYPGISAAMAVAHEDQAGHKRLVAYIVAHAGQSIAEPDLRAYLKARLPEYMIPTAFVTLDALPLNSNGKVDRNALPAPDSVVRETACDAPVTATEQLIAQIWADMLHLEHIGRTAHFFALGGHSLLATQVASRVRHAFSVDLPLRVLFEAPVLSEYSERVEAARHSAGGLLAPPISRCSREAPLPLSFAQQRLWFIDQLSPGSPNYNIAAAVKLTGVLNADALGRTLNEIVRRHETLRTTFQVANAQPVQVIHPFQPFDLPVISLEHLPPLAREEQTLQLAQRDARQPFDLADGPLMRASLLRLGNDEHVMLLAMHHIISDGWSMGVLVREVAAHYTAYCLGISVLSDNPPDSGSGAMAVALDGHAVSAKRAGITNRPESRDGEPYSLPALNIQYADFAVWQRNWLSGDVLDAQIAYWRAQLAGLATLQLPTDRTRPAEQSHHGGTHACAISPELREQLEQLSRRNDVTLFMTLLAAWHVLLSRYTGQDDIVVGSPIAGRNRAETENLIGFFVNTLVLRGDLAGNPDFTALLGRVREACLAAYGHQDIPFEQLVETLAPARDRGRHPLFQVMFTLQNAPMGELALPGLSLSLLKTERATAKFDLAVDFTPTSEGLAVQFHYAADLFDLSTIARMAGHFENVLRSIVSAPDRRLSEHVLLSDTERRQILVEFNETESAYPANVCLHQLFEQYAAQTPDAVAVVFENHALTYAELNKRANQLAHVLQELGVGPDMLVGLCLERGLEMVLGVLGIHKAGGAYTALDPEHPAERLAFLISDARLHVVITGSRRVDVAEGLVTVDIERDWAEIATRPADNPKCTVTSRNLAYVIFTSGSTGKPKGVLTEHRQVVNYITSAFTVLGYAPGTSWAMQQKLTVDAPVTYLFGAFCSGSTLHVLGEDVSMNGIALGRYLQRHAIDYFKVAPSYFASLATADGALEDLIPSRILMIGGEALNAKWAQSVIAQRPKCRILNHYGPTETTVGCLVREVRQDLSDVDGIVPIGRPLSNVQAYVLDRYLEPVPQGVAGKVYIAGDGLARGYLGRPDLTASRFIPDPFGGVPGGRLYDTGDLARYLDGGVIDFLGRVDHQVKIRGFRVELGEIEATLAQHPSIGGVVVDAYEDGPDRKQLVAYVAAASGQSVDVSDLRGFLKTRLPDYMIPASFMVLDSLPLTPQGKVDRKALPAPEHGGREIAGEAPRTLVEELTAQIWADLLRVAGVGREDDFFALGGHSLLATQVISRIRDAFKIELPLRVLFEAPGLAEFCERIEAMQRASDGLQAPPITARSRDAALPLSFAQQRLWFIDQLAPDSGAYNSSSRLRLRGRFDIGALTNSFHEIIRRHEILRTRIVSVDDEAVQEVLPPFDVTVSVIDLSHADDAAREATAHQRAMEEGRRPFDLSVAPHVRMLALRLAEDDHIVVFTVHHIASDGWSTGIIIREFMALYEAYRTGNPSPLAPLAVQYADFAVWQREWLRGDVLDQQLAYWRGQLAGLTPLELRADHPRPLVASRRGETAAFALSRDLSEALQELSRRHGVTLFMTLAAAWQILMSRWSGQTDIVTGTDVAGRNRAEIEDLVGFFINQLVIRSRIDDAMSFADLLRQVRETTLAAYAHQDLPFDRLVEELAPKRNLSRAPLFQVKLVLQNTPQEDLSLDDLVIDRLGETVEAAKLDLQMNLKHAPAQGISGVLRYAVDLFETATIRRMLGHFEKILEAAVADAGCPLSSISLFKDDERRQVLSEWSYDEQSLMDNLDGLSEEELDRLLRDTSMKGSSV